MIHPGTAPGGEADTDLAGEAAVVPVPAAGPALLADWLIADDLASGRLVDLFPEHEAAATDFDTAAWLVYPSRAYLPRKTRAAIDFLRDHVPRAAG